MKSPWIIAASLLMCVVVVEIAQCKEKNPKLYNIVLIGATGDLAQKYLWKALFNLFQDQYQKEKVCFNYHIILKLFLYEKKNNNKSVVKVKGQRLRSNFCT